MLNRSVRAKLMTCVAGSVGLLLIVCLTAIVSLRNNSEDYQELLDGQIDYEGQVYQLNLNFNIQVQEWKNVLLRGAEVATIKRTK